MNSKNKNGFKVKEKIRIAFFIFQKFDLIRKRFVLYDKSPKKLATISKFFKFKLVVYALNFCGTKILLNSDLKNQDLYMSFF
ncbi:hypothetical protein LEP1GSC133_0998 [Leptospira borgpetersenii serovar Pomona str. 200901868]|uniref:Uncharacterized protein n=1 Tax=Leptospira borgpetersenii serovar Pomona str. 200901868 TaxID=1192866 RepID=M6WFN7_LEPBO|nr:hypothetical protein LEP1GSC133_0998 [Leptospira borgpetersenii serovar Pomona str. 200901868]